MALTSWSKLGIATLVLLALASSMPRATLNVAQATIGINVSGAEYSWMPFAGTKDLDYLKSKGITLIRLPISWERMQPTLNGPLDTNYLKGLKNVLSEAAARDMAVIVDVHNYGRYNLDYAADAAANGGIVSPNTPVPNTTLPKNMAIIGSAALPNSTFANFWGQLAKALNGQPGLAYYDLMNEPYNMGDSNVWPHAAKTAVNAIMGSTNAWPSAAQAAVNAIRAVDMNTKILVEGTQWASAYWWPYDNGNLRVNDPADKLLYEAHIYFDGDWNGRYPQSYAEQGASPTIGIEGVQPFLDWLKKTNAQGFIGEFGVPNNDPRWIQVLNNFIDKLQACGISGTYWNYVYPDPSGKNSWWPVADQLSVMRPDIDQQRQDQSLIEALAAQATAGTATASNMRQ